MLYTNANMQNTNIVMQAGFVSFKPKWVFYERRCIDTVIFTETWCYELERKVSWNMLIYSKQLKYNCIYCRITISLNMNHHGVFRYWEINLPCFS